MRTNSVRLGVVVAIVSVALMLAAPTAAQDRWRFDVAAGSSFGNIGTTFQASSHVGYKVNEWFALTGEVGVPNRIYRSKVPTRSQAHCLARFGRPRRGSTATTRT